MLFIGLKKQEKFVETDMLILQENGKMVLLKKVLGDPLADYDAKEIIDQLIEMVLIL